MKRRGALRAKPVPRAESGLRAKQCMHLKLFLRARQGPRMPQCTHQRLALLMKDGQRVKLERGIHAKQVLRPEVNQRARLMRRLNGQRIAQNT